MATIAVDIDDTLYSFCDLARKVLTEEAFRTGDERRTVAAYAPWPEWRSPVDLLGLDEWMRIIGLCHDDEMILAQRPYDGAVEVLWELVDAGHDLLYISNRATETRLATQRWLVEQGFPIDVEWTEDECATLVVTAEDKKPYIAHCQYLIDDRPKTQVAFLTDPDWHADNRGTSTAQRKVFSLAKEFNRGLTDVPGIYLAPTWIGIRHFLVKEGLIKEQVPA